MSSAFLSGVVDALRFSASGAEGGDHPCDAHDDRQTLFAFPAGEWSRSIGLLDRTGLSLPLYARLLETRKQVLLPRQAAALLERRRIDNGRRMRGMLESFAKAAAVLDQAEVPFICVKGFSLFPEFSSDLWQRHQVDFDLLIAPRDADRAQQALERLGYQLTAIAEDGERRMRIPARQRMTRQSYLFGLQQSSTVELHSHFWEAGAEELPLRCPEDVFEQAQRHTIGSISFLRLSPAHAFLYQVLHVFRHFLGSWARLHWLYEIASYLHRHRADNALWLEVQALFSADPRLAEAGALVLLIAQDLFGCPVPAALHGVCTLPAGSPIALWIARYARPWILTDAPGNKLNLLLQKHFFSDEHAWRRYLVNRLVPRGKHPTLCEGIDAQAAKSLRFRAANLRFQAGRAWHHLRTGTGFAFASIAWKIQLRLSESAFAAGDLRQGEL